MASVSAIIPTTGRIELRRAVVSVLKQTVYTRPVVVNDRPAARDQVHDLLKGLDYSYFETDGARGGSFARNIGVRQSASDFVAFLDDDDEWYESKTERQLAIHQAEKEKDIVTSSLTEFVESAGKARIIPENPYDGSVDMASYLLDRSTIRLRRNYMQTSSLMGPRDLFVAHYWDETLPKHQDWDLLIRVSQFADIRVVREPLVTVYQDSTGSVSRRHMWDASVEWMDRRATSASAQSRGDFLAAIALRSAIAARDCSGVLSVGRRLLAARPHFSALVVATVGLRERV